MSVQRHESVGAYLFTEHPEQQFSGNGNACDVEMQRILRENRRLREDNENLNQAVSILNHAPK